MRKDDIRTTKIHLPTITQLRILEFLAKNGEQEGYDIPNKVVIQGVLGWKAFRILVANKLISKRSEGEFPTSHTYYKITESGQRLIDVIAELEKLYDSSSKT